MTNIDQAEPKRSASFTIEERRSLLAEFKTSELHYADFAKQKNISKRTFACWLRYESLSPEKKASFRYHGPYSPTERKKTIEAYVSSGMILEEFAAAWGMSPSTLSGWMQRYQAGGLQALERYRPAKAGDKRRGSRLPVAVRQEIIAIKRKEPWFGLRKIRDWLLRRLRRIKRKKAVPATGCSGLGSPFYYVILANNSYVALL